MLYNWSWMPPEFVNGLRWFSLGPYFNILPILTIPLFMLQQKMYTPPPTDEQSAMQQKMMKYMTFVICFMFYKVASGLCLYFIASSLWGLAERRLLPKAAAAAAAGRETSAPPEKSRHWFAAFGRSNNTDRKKKRKRNRDRK